MSATGYIAAVVLAALLTGGTAYVVKRPFQVKDILYLFVLAFMGVYGGSELFGAIGEITSISEHGPAIGGFYVLTGLVGGLLMAAAGSYALHRAAEGQSTDVAVTDGIRDPKIAHALFSDTRASALWLAIRLYIGYEWLSAGWHKLGGFGFDGKGWMDGGAALKGYWTNAVDVSDPAHPTVAYGWYRDFIQYMLDHEWYTWFAKVIAVGETLVGIALILGVLVGIAAFFGALMNFNFMLAGSASTNPVLFGAAVLLILAWKVAGYYGLDRYLLPALGAPWTPGRVFRHERPSPAHSIS